MIHLMRKHKRNRQRRSPPGKKPGKTEENLNHRSLIAFGELSHFGMTLRGLFLFAPITWQQYVPSYGYVRHMNVQGFWDPTAGPTLSCNVFIISDSSTYLPLRMKRKENMEF